MKPSVVDQGQAGRNPGTRRPLAGSPTSTGRTEASPDDPALGGLSLGVGLNPGPSSWARPTPQEVLDGS